MKRTHCDYCGEDLGGPVESYGEPVTCGKLECDREARDDYRAARAERQANAEEDDFRLYGGYR